MIILIIKNKQKINIVDYQKGINSYIVLQKLLTIYIIKKITNIKIQTDR